MLALLWRAQHLALDRLRRLDNVVVILNFVVLALATAVPFSSELLGEYSGQSVAVAIYAANISIAYLAIAAISWWSDLRDNQLDGVGAWDPLAVVPGAVFLVSIPIALVSPDLAPYVWLGTLLVVPLHKMRHRG